MNTHILTPASVMQMGLERISKLVEIHGITSPQVFAACERWGGILDDLNYPDSTCLHCAEPVVWDGRYYIHDNRPKGPTARWCISHSGREATPKVITKRKVVPDAAFKIVPPARVHEE